MNWTTAGGTFAASASATTNVTNVLGPFSWTSAQLATDVKNWLTTPATNFGWILTADETIVASPTAHGFVSREGAAAQRPQLQINYSGASLTRREFWLRQYFPAGKFVDDAADLDGDGIANLIEYAFGFSPLAQNPPGAGFQVSAVPAGGNVTFTITFRRDPRAVDLTYLVQTSGDLVELDHDCAECGRRGAEWNGFCLGERRVGRIAHQAGGRGGDRHGGAGPALRAAAGDALVRPKFQSRRRRESCRGRSASSIGRR